MEDDFFNDNSQIISSITIDELNALAKGANREESTEENIPENDRFLDSVY